jgi:hypothetical protein
MRHSDTNGAVASMISRRNGTIAGTDARLAAPHLTDGTALASPAKAAAIKVYLQTLNKAYTWTADHPAR